jgi:tetratricopeptide (TPR) repeat protein
MIGLITSMLPSSNFSSFGFAAKSTGATGFGPDFLLSALSSQSFTPGAAYDPNGESPDTKARAAALTQAKDLLRAGDPAGARDAANQVLQKNPSDAIAAAYVGRTFLAEGNYREAVRFFSRAASGSDDAQIQVDLRSAQTLLKGPDATVAEIRRLLKSPMSGREGASLAGYFLDQNPGNVEARTLLVQYYEAGGHTNLAGGELTDALDKVSDEDRGQLVAAIEKFNQAHADDPASYDLLAQAYVRADRLEDAQTAFAKALELSSDNTEFQVQIKEDYSNTFLKLGQAKLATGDEAGAQRLLQQGIDIFATPEIKSELSNLDLGRGERQTRQWQLNLALASLDDARANMPGTADKVTQDKLITAYENLAAKYAAVGDLKSVTSALYGAYIIDPANDTHKRALANAFDSYGQDLASKGDYQAAIRQFRAALSYYSQDANYAAHLGDAQGHL